MNEEKTRKTRPPAGLDTVGAVPLEAILPPAGPGPRGRETITPLPAGTHPQDAPAAAAGLPAPESPVMGPVAHQPAEARVSLAWLAVEGVAGSLVRAAETLEPGPKRKAWVIARLVKYASHAEGLFQLEPGTFRPGVEFLADPLVERIFQEQVQAGHVNRNR